MDNQLKLVMRILFWTEKIYCVWQFRGSFYSLGAMGGRSYKGQTSPICSFAANEIPAQISPEVLHEKGNSKYLDNNATKVLLERVSILLSSVLCVEARSQTPAASSRQRKIFLGNKTFEHIVEEKGFDQSQ